MSDMNLREATPTSSECRTDGSNPESGNVQFKLECILGCKIDDTSKEVIALDCFHFVCSDSCVQKLKSSCKSGSRLMCTVCSRFIEPDKLERKLVPDEIFVKKHDFTSTELICENCIHNRPAIAFCPQCPLLLCGPCYELHPQTRATKEHKVSEDIAEQKSKQLVKLLEDYTKCPKHKKPLLNFCLHCDLKICQYCAASHQGHPTCNIENERQALKSRIERQRKFRETLHQAVEEITAKTNEIKNVERRRIYTQIKEHFLKMFNILKKEANERVEKQVDELLKRRRCAELSIGVSERFSKIAENVLDNHADTAAIILLRQFGDSVESLDQLERTFASDYNDYVDKDWHFGLDLSTTAKAQKYLRKYCQVEYSYKPSSSTSSSLIDSVPSVAPTNGSVCSEVQQPVITASISSPDVCATSLSIAEENTRVNAQKSDETDGMPVLSPCVPIKLDPESSSSAQARPEGASPDSHMSSVSESSELGMGKGERKKKEFHDFVDTDKSQKLLRKQNSEAASAASVRQKSSKAALLLQKVPENEGGDEDSANGPKAVDEEDDVSIDGYSFEGPALRRQSLRKRTINNPDTPPETSTRKRLRASSLGPNNTIDDSTFQEAPESSFDVRPDPDCDYPVQGQGRMKITSTDENEDNCCICLGEGEEIMICCDFCPKVFHMTCHLPVIENIPEREEKWRCNHDTPKETIDELVASFPNPEGSEKWQLTDSNKHHFILACKFVMECYKIPEIPTMRWVFPEGYKVIYGKLPFHMKYIREKLCRGIPKPFSGVEDMLLAFRQMFIQAFLFYTKKQQKVRPMAIKCFEKFLELIDEYYPKYRELFKNVLLE